MGMNREGKWFDLDRFKEMAGEEDPTMIVAIGELIEIKHRPFRVKRFEGKDLVLRYDKDEDAKRSNKMVNGLREQVDNAKLEMIEQKVRKALGVEEK